MAALLCPPPPQEQRLPNLFARIRTSWSMQSRPRRELLILAAALASGLLLLPLLIWIIGQGVLGDYAGGGLFSFLGDFFVALSQGELAFWLIVLGPAVLLMLARLLWMVLRSDRQT